MANDEEKIQQIYEAAFEESAEYLVAELKRTAPHMLEESRAYSREFEARLRERWGRALDLLEMIIVIAEEDGEAFNHKYRPAAAETKDYVFDVLTRLHARACLTASEVQALLITGHASGAMTRWRTLHELAVVACVIEHSGQACAERYLLHEVCESVRAVEDYIKYQAQLGVEVIDDHVLTELRARRDALWTRFGPEFKNKYGWAAGALGKKDPTIIDLEKAANLQHLRPYYRMSSHGVHPNPKGIAFNLGLLPQDNLLLAGPSNGGLADPGQSTALSLLQCTAALLSIRQDPEHVIILMALAHLVDEARSAFFDIHQDLVREEEVIQANQTQPS